MQPYLKKLERNVENKMAFKAFKNYHTGSLDNTASSFLNFPFDIVELI